METQPLVEQSNLWFPGGFQASTGAEPPWKDKNVSPTEQIPVYAHVSFSTFLNIG